MYRKSPLRYARSAFLGGLLLTVAVPLSAAAEEAYLSLSENDCARLARHYPADDVTLYLRTLAALDGDTWVHVDAAIAPK